MRDASEVADTSSLAWPSVVLFLTMSLRDPLGPGDESGDDMVMTRYYEKQNREGLEEDKVPAL